MKLPRLQLHLSTLLIVSLLEAGLVWANVRKHTLSFDIFVPLGKKWPHTGRGWPLTYEHINDDPLPGARRYFWDWTPLTMNILACLALLDIATVVIEWLTRRMKRGAP